MGDSQSGHAWVGACPGTARPRPGAPRFSPSSLRRPGHRRKSGFCRSRGHRGCDAAPAIAAPAIAAPQETAQNQPVAEGTGVAPPDAKTDARVALKNAAPKTGGRKATGKVEAATGASLEAPAPKAEPVAAAPRRAPLRVAEVPRDPWQAMNEGLSRCAREDFLSRFACEQRMRQQYCPNYWGLVPQCAIGRTNDHGQ